MEIYEDFDGECMDSFLSNHANSTPVDSIPSFIGAPSQNASSSVSVSSSFSVETHATIPNGSGQIEQHESTALMVTSILCS
jgi:hypothetical protein